MKVQVVATDGLDTEAIEAFKKSPLIELRVHKGLEPSELLNGIKDADIVIIRSATVLDKRVLENCPQLKGILRAGVGIDNIDLKGASDLGIWVWNAPTGNFQSTAEMALALLFSLARRIPEATLGGRKNLWLKKDLSSKGRQLAGSTLGVFGAGNIGKRTLTMARGLGMYVQVCDPYFNQSDFPIVDFDTLLKTSDFICIHAPLLPETKGVFNLEAFKKMKKSSFIINAARGGIIKDADLLVALKEGLIEGAGLDVFEEEPFDKNPLYQELLNLPQVVSSPHMGAATKEAQRLVGLESAQKILSAVEYVLGNKEVTFPPSLNKPTQPRWRV